MPDSTENSRAVAFAREDEALEGRADDKDPPSPTFTTASTSSPYACDNQTAGNSSLIPDCLFTCENLQLFQSVSVKPMLPEAVNSGTMHSKSSSFYKARKTRKKHCMHTMFLLGSKPKKSSMHTPYPIVSEDIVPSVRKHIDNSVEMNDWLPSKRTAPQSPSEGAKQLHVKSKLIDNIDNYADAVRVEKTYHNVARDGNILKNNDELDVYQQHFLHSTSDASKEGFGKEHGDIKANETDRKEAVLFGQQTHFVAWFAGLTIRALWFHLRFLSHLCITLLLAWYHSFLFALNPMGYMLKAKVRAIEAHEKENNRMVTLSPKIKERVFSLQPTFVKGARRLVFGCSTAFYTIMILTLLFVMSLMLGHLVVKGFVYEPIQLFEDLHFDYTKPLPVASVDFSFSKVYPDTGSMMRRIARPTRKFCATVFFTLPESDFNKELGIFQVTTQLLSVTGQVLLSRTQPCMLRFRSTALQRAKSLLLAIPLLTGFYSETQTLAVSPLEWHERRAFSFAAVKVMLAPRAGRLSATGLPELYEAKIHVNSELPWWVCIIGHWRLTLSVWIGLAFFIGVVVLLLFVCKQLLIPDLGCVFSVITDGLAYGKFLEGKATRLKREKLVSESALEDIPLGSKHAEIKDSLCTS